MVKREQEIKGNRIQRKCHPKELIDDSAKLNSQGILRN